MKIGAVHKVQNKKGEYTPFVPAAIKTAIGWLFEHGSETVSCGLKVSCGFFLITMLKKPPYRHDYGDGDKPGMLPKKGLPA